MQVGRVAWQQAAVPEEAPAPSPLKVPTSLHLPIGLHIDRLRVDELTLNGQPQLHQLSAQLDLGNGSRHHLRQVRLNTDRFDAQAELHIETQAPLRVEAHALLLNGAGPHPWQADVRLTGPWPN